MKYVANIDPRLTLVEPEKFCQFPVFVRFAGEFSEENCTKFRQDLIQAENAALEAKQKVLPIIVDSYGGDVYALMACIDAINAVSPELTIATIVEGKAMSCGAVLFSCGHEGYRFIGQNATVMIHEVSSVHFGKNEELKASAKEADRLNEKLFEIMAANCGKPKDYFVKEITDRHHADWFLSAKDCMEHNLANVIGLPKFDIKVEMTVNFVKPEMPTTVTTASKKEAAVTAVAKTKTKKTK